MSMIDHIRKLKFIETEDGTYRLSAGLRDAWIESDTAVPVKQ